MSKLQSGQDAGYSEQSAHFHNTRKKRWPEVDHLQESLEGWKKGYKKRKQTVIDLGCGSGRLAPLLLDVLPGMSYVGVDSAQGMVTQAQKEYSMHDFFCDDMTAYMSGLQQESVDCVVALASLQHLQGKETHLLALSHIYKTLRRGGRCYLINRSFSDWFLKKYRRNVGEAIVRSTWKQGRAWNDVVIPRKDKSFHKNGIQFDRMYHMFPLHELEKAAKTVGFVVKESCYIDQQGAKSTKRRTARNSYIVLEKGV